MQPKYVKEIANEIKNYVQKGIYSEDYFDPSLSSNYVINKFTTTWNSNLVDHMKKRPEMNISNIEKQMLEFEIDPKVLIQLKKEKTDILEVDRISVFFCITLKNKREG